MPAPYPEFDGSQNCASTDPEAWFFPHVRPRRDETHVLERICSGCSYVEPCREYAVHHLVDGYWGGTTLYDRSRIRKARNIIPVNLETRRSA